MILLPTSFVHMRLDSCALVFNGYGGAQVVLYRDSFSRKLNSVAHG